jgi:hypothetical protein
MENIYVSLVKELPELERHCKGEKPLIEHAVASRLLCLCFGWEWYERTIAFQDNADEWMHNLKGDTSENRVLYTRRVIQLGDAVFTLLKTNFKGGDILKQRFLTRPIKPCFAETEIAGLLAYNGYQVEVIGESGVRGEDFDLAASKDGVTLSIEITAKEDGPLTVQNILNTLKYKRTQVPSHRPAVLYLRIPSEWMAEPDKNRAIFTEAFQEFSRTSRRFNAYILTWENLVPFLNGAFLSSYMQPCYNHNARHPYSPSHLLTPIPSSDGRVQTTYSFLDWLRTIQSKTVTSG